MSPNATRVHAALSDYGLTETEVAGVTGLTLREVTLALFELSLLNYAAAETEDDLRRWRLVGAAV